MKINFKRVNVRDLFDENNKINEDFVHEIHTYVYTLRDPQLIIMKNIQSETLEKHSNKFKLEYRIKTLERIESKLLEYYINPETTYGRSSLIKCINDLMGFRFIIKTNKHLDDFEALIKKFFRSVVDKYDVNVRILLRNISLDEISYKAIHVYIKEDNYHFPWEIQFWRKKDEINNRISHRKHKQKHIKLKKNNIDL